MLLQQECFYQQITIIHKPQIFYTTLLEKCKRAKKRITFASLYLGTGPLETKLVSIIKSDKFIIKKLVKPINWSKKNL